MKYLDELKRNWNSFFLSKKNIYFFITILVLLALVLGLFTRFLQYVELRNGFAFDDPILIQFNPIDLTWIIFIMIYGGLVLALISLVKSPQVLTLALLTYLLMVIFRIAAMYTLPLNPPESMLALKDPFVEFFGGGKTLTKDLFFSGHTATSLIFFLTAKNKIIKKIFLFLTVVMGASVLLMHVHYSVDVLIAPLVSFTAFIISKNILKKFEIFS